MRVHDDGDDDNDDDDGKINQSYYTHREKE